MRVIGGVLVWLVLGSVVEAAAPRPEPTAEQRKQLAEWKRLIERAMGWVRTGAIGWAADCVQQAHAIDVKLCGPGHSRALYTLEVLGRMQMVGGKFGLAEETWTRAAQVAVGLHGEDHWSVSDARREAADARRAQRWSAAQRARFYEMTSLRFRADAQGDSAAAFTTLQKVFFLAHELYGPDHPAPLQILSEVATLKRELPGHDAVGLSEYLVGEVRRRLGPNHPAYASELGNLGFTYMLREEVARGLPLVEEAARLTARLKGIHDPGYATTLVNVAGGYGKLGSYARAVRAAEEALALMDADPEVRHQHVPRCLNVLSGILAQQGEYHRALPYAERAWQMAREQLGPRNPITMMAQAQVARTLGGLGDDVRARSLMESAHVGHVRLRGPDDPKSLLLQTMLGHLYEASGDPERGLEITRDALERQRRVLGPTHPEVISALEGVAGQYRMRGDLARAVPLVGEVVRLTRERYAPEHPAHVSRLVHLAEAMLALGNPAEARRRFSEAQTYSRQGSGGHARDEVDLLAGLAKVDWLDGKLMPAVEGFEVALARQRRKLADEFSVLSERQRVERVGSTRGLLDHYLTLASQAALSGERRYRQVLAWKGATTARQIEDRLEQAHPELGRLFIELRGARSAVARWVAEPPSPGNQAAWRRRLDELESRKEDVERRLAMRSQEFRQARAGRELEPADVARALPEGTALVDFVDHHWSTPPRDGKRPPHVHHLEAFVIRRGLPVLALELGPSDPIYRAVSGWRRSLLTGKTGQPAASEAATLRRLVWERIEKALGPCRTVLVCPDGPLGALPLAALPGRQEGTYLLEEYTFVTLPFVQHMVQRDASSAPGAATLLAVGALDYGKPPPGQPVRHEELPGTRLEVERLVEAHRRTHPGVTAEVLTDRQGDRETLLGRLSGPEAKAVPRYLHLALHGFFVRPIPRVLPPTGPLPEQDPRCETRTPGVLSALALAGANRSMQALLTAEEVCELNLRGCELVTLSACETGLGAIAVGEGMFGLQRAFHVAGARNVVTSLWRVSDAATSVLMERFYENLWVRRLPRAEALREAQLYVLRHPQAVEARVQALREVARVRGISLKAETGPALPAQGDRARSPVLLWAGFALSGDAS
ncbi:MAG: CHAT domain-containing tetratricopeptide repeat protein [Gemmataceae bacterium]